MVLHSLSKLQKQGQMGINYGDRQEEKTNGAYGSRSRLRHKLEIEDTVRAGRSLDTPNRMTSMYRFYSSSSSRRHRLHHRHHPYKRNEYFPKEFKKFEPSTFDGEMKKSKDA